MNGDLISRSAFRRELVENRCFFPIIVKLALEAEPSVDAVAVVRCGECKHYKEHYCTADGVWCAPLRSADFFCAAGERRDDEG